jgi:hypothetical protein
MSSTAVDHGDWPQCTRKETIMGFDVIASMAANLFGLGGGGSEGGGFDLSKLLGGGMGGMGGIAGGLLGAVGGLLGGIFG